MTNSFQNFNEAMQCVLRGGKAWRESWGNFWLAIEPKEKIAGGYLMTYTLLTGDTEPTKYSLPALNQDDLTATDWVWEEASV